MTTIELDGYIFSVDIEKTREYYQKQEFCECPNCRNCYAQIKDAFPLLGEFLKKFGADIGKPDNIESYDDDDGKTINYLSTDYTVCGKIVTMGEYEIDIKDSQFLSITVINDFASPNRQGDNDYFTLCVNFFEFPWVLDEEFPLTVRLPADTETHIAIDTASKIRNFFRRLFRR